jgi:uncharacterized protein with HEPN domain
MPLRDDSVSLRQMLEHAREAIALLGSATHADLELNRVLTLALVQLAQIVGEAASRVSEPKRVQYPQIPWRQIVSLRNRLIHGYDTIDLEILWQIVKNDMPSLVAQLEAADD